MEKRSILFVSLLVAVTGQLMSMQPDAKSCLIFTLNNKLKIQAAREQGGMKFATDRDKFMKRNILNAIPMSKKDRNSVKSAFKLARTAPSPVVTSYTLTEDQGNGDVQQAYNAKITALMQGKKGKKLNFIVEVEAKTTQPSAAEIRFNMEQNDLK